MCIGVPMRILETLPGQARAESRSGRHVIDIRLVPGVVAGDWVMVLLDAAREIISPETAAKTADALEALEIAMRGGDFDHLFGDLIGREPQLPDHLKPEET